MTLAPLISTIYGLGLTVLSGKVEGLPEPNERMTEQQLTPNLTLHALRLPPSCLVLHCPREHCPMCEATAIFHNHVHTIWGFQGKDLLCPPLLGKTLLSFRLFAF